jgi:hypothetical protein
MHPFWSSHEEKRVCVRLFMEAAMAGIGAPLMVAWQAYGRDEGGGRRRGAAGGAAWGEGQQGGAVGEGAMGGGGTAPVAAWSLFYVRAGRKQEQGERRGKKRRKKRKKYEKFSKLGKYLKNKR